jgi:hypothetical protein
LPSTGATPSSSAMPSTSTMPATGAGASTGGGSNDPAPYRPGSTAGRISDASLPNPWGTASSSSSSGGSNSPSAVQASYDAPVGGNSSGTIVR